MREGEYQSEVIKKLKKLFPGCVVLKNDPSYVQGVPDLTVLWKDRWAMLEVKLSKNSPDQPNQKFYVEQLGEMSFAAFIYPENEQEVLSELQRSFGTIRETRLP